MYQKEVHHTGDGVGPVHSRRAILQNVDVIDHWEGNQINVHASTRPDGVQRTKCDTFSINQHQGFFGQQAAQVELNGAIPAGAGVHEAGEDNRAELLPAGRENAPDNDPGLPLVVRFATPRVIDVMQLQFVQQALGDVVLPSGTYSQIRLILDPNPNGQGQQPANYLVLKSDLTTKIPLTTPSAQQSGLKVLGPIEIKPGIINAIMIDFDPNTAIVARGNGDYNLKPTGIRLVRMSEMLTQYGSISGVVSSTFKDWSSATLSVVPQGSSTPIAAGRLFSNFTSSRWEAPFSAFVPDGTYRVHVQANRFNTYSSPPTTVAGGVEKSLGDILLVPAAP